MSAPGRAVPRAAVAVAAALAAVGCGSNPSALPTTTGPEPSATAPSTAPTATLASTSPPTVTTAAPADRTLVAFADPTSVEGWSTVDDRVMGGVSRSTVDWQDGRLRFTGVVSLENNGGFSSARGPLVDLGSAAAGASTFVVSADGDGTTYLLQVTDRDGGRWVQRFPTTAGVSTEHVLAVAGFAPVTSRLNPRVADAPLDPARVTQFTVYVVDDQTGPFDLRIARIAAR